MENSENNINQAPVQGQGQQIQQSSWTVPGAIIIAGILIAGSVYYPNQNQGQTAGAVGSVKQAEDDSDTLGLDNMLPVSDKDHILGNANALVKIVEYSDTECPFCKKFHITMQKVMGKYGAEGKVAWVYRHFPLDSLHSKARKESEATECANELGGNAKFWAYMDRLMEVTPSNNSLDLNQLPEIAKYVGLDEEKFKECLDSGRHAERVSNDLKNATQTGGQGTPWSILIGKDGKKYPINGALPYEQMEVLIEQALK